MTYRTDGLGRVTGYTWDALNRPTSITYRPSIGAGASATVTYTWDSAPGCSHGIGRLCAVSDRAGSTTYSYNDKGHRVSATRVEAGQTHVTQYVRDAAGQVLSWVDPAASSFMNARATNGKIRDLSMLAAGDASPVAVVSDMQYDAAGALTGSNTGDDRVGQRLSVARQYDPEGRLADSVQAVVAAPDGDVPLPLWALVALGGALCGAVSRRSR